MNEASLLEQQAQAIAALMPALMRGLSTLSGDRAAELPLAQLRVCSILRDGPRPMSTLSRELRVSLSAMTQIADRLERAGLVQRVAEQNDRRVRCLRLTPRGDAMMRRREVGRVAAVWAALEHMPPQSRVDVLSALDTLMNACRAAADDRHGAVQAAGDLA